MKASKQFQYRLLQKHIDLCELANGLVNNFEALTRRELTIAVTKLLENNILLPYSLRLQLTRKKIQFYSEDLLQTCTKPTAAEPAKVKQNNQEDIITQLLHSLTAWKGSEEGWNFTNASFAALAAEVQDETEELYMKDPDTPETTAKCNQLNEDGPGPVCFSVKATATDEMV